MQDRKNEEKNSDEKVSLYVEKLAEELEQKENPYLYDTSGPKKVIDYGKM